MPQPASGSCGAWSSTCWTPGPKSKCRCVLVCVCLAGQCAHITPLLPPSLQTQSMQDPGAFGPRQQCGTHPLQHTHKTHACLLTRSCPATGGRSCRSTSPRTSSPKSTAAPTPPLSPTRQDRGGTLPSLRRCGWRLVVGCVVQNLLSVYSHCRHRMGSMVPIPRALAASGGSPDRRRRLLLPGLSIRPCEPLLLCCCTPVPSLSMSNVHRTLVSISAGRVGRGRSLGRVEVVLGGVERMPAAVC